MAVEVRVCLSLAVLAAVVLLVVSCGGVASRLSDVSASLYTRHDSDETNIWSPRASASARIGEQVGVQAAYAMDAWTSASIDIRSGATLAVHEKRHELEAGADYAFGDVNLSGAYRYSTENDYWSHGGVLTLALDLAQRNTTFALSVLGAHDIVGKHGDPQFSRPLDSAGGRLTWTQVLSEQSLMQLSWETTFWSGYQASPYRWVSLSGAGACAEPAAYCVPERVPDQRARHALGVRYRHALGTRLSVGLGYRLYADGWDVWSHTLEPGATLRVGDSAELNLDYRYYTQSDAEFYRPRYVSGEGSYGYVTRDRKLSTFYSHSLGLAFIKRWELGSHGQRFSIGARAGGTLYDYLAYVGLEHVQALELTALVQYDDR